MKLYLYLAAVSWWTFDISGKSYSIRTKAKENERKTISSTTEILGHTVTLVKKKSMKCGANSWPWTDEKRITWNGLISIFFSFFRCSSRYISTKQISFGLAFVVLTMTSLFSSFFSAQSIYFEIVFESFKC